MTAFPYIQSIMMKIGQALEKVEKDFREGPSLAYWVPKEIEEKLREMFSSARNAGDLERAVESVKKLLAKLKQMKKQLEKRLEEEKRM